MKMPPNAKSESAPRRGEHTTNPLNQRLRSRVGIFRNNPITVVVAKRLDYQERDAID